MYRYIGIFLDGPLVLLLPCHWENRVNSNFPFGWHRGPLVRPDGTLGSAACLVRPVSLFSWPVCVSFVCSNLLLHWQLFFSVLPQFSFWKFFGSWRWSSGSRCRLLGRNWKNFVDTAMAFCGWAPAHSNKSHTCLQNEAFSHLAKGWNWKWNE